MSFAFDAFYLIEPRADLGSHLMGRTDPDFASILLEPVLVRNKEGGRTVWTNEMHAATVKLLYLARLREYSPLASDEDAERMLGSSRISEAVFDQWWTIRRLEVEEDTAELVQYLRLVAKKVDQPQDELVSAWLEQILGKP